MILIVSVSFTPFLFSNSKAIKVNNDSGIKTAGTWTISPITINGYSSNDWAYYASHYPWCYGSGTKTDPYIIENVTINGNGSGDLIMVEYTDDYFIIQNCHLYNGEYGILLDSVDNGKLINNNIHSNLYAGISNQFGDNLSVLNNNITENSGTGIYVAGDNIEIAGNNCSLNNDGIYIDDCLNVNISNNMMSDNLGYGIILYGHNCNVTNNLIERNVNSGIRIIYNDSNRVENNIFEGNGVGVEIYSSSENLIVNNTIRNNLGSGITIGGGSTHNYISKNAIMNNPNGIWIEAGGNVIEKNKIVNNLDMAINLRGSYNAIYCNNLSLNNYGVYVSGVYGIDAIRIGNNISNNDISYNTLSGININYGFNNNTISNNSIRSNGNAGIHGVWLYDVQCIYNVIAENLIYDNGWSGIELYRYDNNSILGNNISGNLNSGIYFDQYCDSNYISSNYLYDNYQQGIYMYSQCDYNAIDNNTIYKNRNNGIALDGWNYNNNFIKNLILDNFNYGVLLGAGGSFHIINRYNLFSENNFTGNGINANDSSTIGNICYTYWNSSTIGNYWDDNLPNTDVNDDGIGDTPYVIWSTPLIQDSLPIFEDGDDPAPPIVSIIFPSENQVIGKVAPTIQISIKGLYVHTRWYELVGTNQNITFTENTVKLDQSLWDEFGNGTVTVRCYINDTLGYGTMDEITVRKDIYKPQLTINSPMNDNLFDNNTPSFNVEVYDPNLLEMWYTIDGGLNNITFITNGTIDQSAWDLVPDGDVTITFYAIDAGSNLASDSVIVKKDTTAPIINIKFPNQYELFGINPLSFNVEIIELNLDKMWYTIQGSSMNITFTSNSTLNQALWDGFGSGNLTVIFYANDSYGRIGFDSVVITKDIDPPTISILAPNSGDTFYVNSPNYEITVNDPHLELIWYTLDGGLTNTTITESSGSISQNIWDSLPIGEITIRFYAKDSVGNINFAEVLINKASVSPNPSNLGIPGYDILITMGILAMVTIVIAFKRYKTNH